MSQDNYSIVEQAISSELSADEKILWCGQPRDGFQFSALNVMTLPFGIALCGVGTFLGLSVWQTLITQLSVTDQSFSGLLPMIVIGIGFIAAGLLLIGGMFYLERYWRRNTYYAVTNQRVIVMTKWLATNVATLVLQQIPLVTLTTRSNGSGSVVFGSTITGTIGSTDYTPLSFDKIDDARKVSNVILDAQLQVGKQ